MRSNPAVGHAVPSFKLKNQFDFLIIFGAVCNIIFDSIVLL